MAFRAASEVRSFHPQPTYQMYHSISSYLFPLIGLLLVGIQITAAAFLLGEGGRGPWMMLVGAGVSLLGQLARWILTIVNPEIAGGSSYSIYLILSSFSIFGLMLFSIGLLLHALRRRGLGNRIAELEAILASIGKH